VRHPPLAASIIALTRNLIKAHSTPTACSARPTDVPRARAQNGDALDHSSRLPNYGSKMGIDATRKWKAEGFERPWPAMIEMDRATKARVDALWAKLGL
jgi:3-polyprenyl-4-hydroxybenzoate decarboxylase